MHKGDYLAQAPVQHFTEWLAGVLCGQPIDFWYGANPQQMDATLAQSLARYAWPVAALQNIQLREPAWGFPAPIWQIGLERYATLQANEDVLHTLQVGLRAAMSQNDQDQDLKAWMAAVMIWGGVYQGGNRNWLHAHAGSLHDVLSETCLALSAGNDEIVLNPPIVFRFNAAMTRSIPCCCMISSSTTVVSPPRCLGWFRNGGLLRTTLAHHQRSCAWRA